MLRSIRNWRGLVAAILVTLYAVPTAGAAQELTLWSHWAAEVAKRTFVEEADQAVRGEPRASRSS